MNSLDVIQKNNAEAARKAHLHVTEEQAIALALAKYRAEHGTTPDEDPEAVTEDGYRPSFNENLCGACKDPDLPDLIDVTHCEWCGVRL